MIKIAMTGTHGTGKTTALNYMATRIDLEFPNLSVARLDEVARKCPYPMNQETTVEAQQWMFETHMAEEKKLRASGADIILCDRTIFDYIVYTLRAASVSNDSLMHDHVKKACEQTANFIVDHPYMLTWFFRPGRIPLVADDVRPADIDFQTSVDRHFLEDLLYSETRRALSLMPWPGDFEAAWAITRRVIINDLEDQGFSKELR